MSPSASRPTAFVLCSIFIAMFTALGATSASAQDEVVPACPAEHELRVLVQATPEDPWLITCLQNLDDAAQTQEQTPPVEPTEPIEPVDPVQPVTRPEPVRPPQPATPVKRRPIQAPPRSTPLPRPLPRHRLQQHSRPTGFQDARTFRSAHVVIGRLPTQPHIAPMQLQLLMRSAAAAGIHWSLLVAVAWEESKWGQLPGPFVGGRLTDQQWQRFATDGNGDGLVDRADQSDLARTLAVALASQPQSQRGTSQLQIRADYYAALGARALMHGLEDPHARQTLQRATLQDDDCILDDAGRADVADGDLDPRVLVAIRFLARRFDSVTVSSLVSGHGVYTTSGRISLHAYGQAVDIAALDGETIAGNQQPGSNTERAVRELLQLPPALQPQELISLWEMGGPSFAAADHADHIHVGWSIEPATS